MLSHFTRRRGREEGYALMFVLFLLALVIIGASAAVLDTWTQGQREKETQMIWRGEQYDRAIGLYYRKFGHFPTSIDNLVKQQNGNIRFLRQAYKNPMNEDGSWRFIYVTPGGQLIGSVRYTSLQQMAFLDKQREMGVAVPSAAAGAPGTSTSDTTQSNGGVQGGISFGSNSSATSSTFGTGPVIGGFIIGVAGKQDKHSIKVYKGGTTYKQWEFIFNPLEQVQTIGGQVGGQPSPGSNPVAPQPPQQIPQQPQL